ncbi:MAG: hypothetical protein ACOY4H_06825 [Thermodesulfobacteriota bacterium]
MTPADRTTPSRTLVRDLLGLPARPGSLRPAGPTLVFFPHFPATAPLMADPWPAAATDPLQPDPEPAMDGARGTLQRPPAPLTAATIPQPQAAGESLPSTVPAAEPDKPWPGTTQKTTSGRLPLPAAATPLTAGQKTFAPEKMAAALSPSLSAPGTMPLKRPAAETIATAAIRETASREEAVLRPRQVVTRPGPEPLQQRRTPEQTAAPPRPGPAIGAEKTPLPPPPMASPVAAQPEPINQAVLPQAARADVGPGGHPSTGAPAREKAAATVASQENQPTDHGRTLPSPPGPVPPAAGIMELRRSFHELMRSRGTARQVKQKHEENRQKPTETARPEEQGPSPPPLQQVVMIRQATATTDRGRPLAFWERSYLTRWTGRIIG